MPDLMTGASRHCVLLEVTLEVEHNASTSRGTSRLQDEWMSGSQTKYAFLAIAECL